MDRNPKFGVAAQTPDQRAEVLARMQRALPKLRAPKCAAIQELYDRYVAGELSWAEVSQALGTLPTR